ncbi:MAG TPA: DUF2382 domain-containing protein [Acidisarcina sp.]
MSKTVVGLFSSVAQAEQVKKTLIADGYESGNIKVVANDEGSSAEDYTTNSSYSTSGNDAGAGTGIGDKISSFFRNLTGGDEDVHHHYAAGVNSGGALLTATVDDDEATEVAATLKEYGARDIDGSYEQAAGAGTPVYSGAGNANLTGETAIPVVEEELVVGKREVDRGGVRIYSHVVERPVEADVTLRDEQINVERRPVNRAATAADFAGGDKSFEVYATGEEAVVGKNSRVVEEVRVGKQSTERTESVQDTVRRTEVEVENLVGNATDTKKNY